MMKQSHFYVGVLGFRLIEDYYLDDQAKRWVVVAPNLKPKHKSAVQRGFACALVIHSKLLLLVCRPVVE